MQKILHPTPFVSYSRMVSLLKTSWNISRQRQKYILTVSLHPLILKDLVVTSELWLSNYIQGSFHMPPKAALLPGNVWKQLCRTTGHIPILFHCLWPIAGFWNLLGVDTPSHISPCLLQKNWECWVSACPGEILKRPLEKTLFGKANKNLGRRLCWKQSYAWEIWLCVFSDHKRSGHQFSIAP